MNSKYFGLDDSQIDYESHISTSHNYPDFILKYLKDIKRSLASDENEYSIQDNIISKADVLIDYSWEKLNTNLWVFVDEKWRYLYAYSTLYKVLCLSLIKKDDNELIRLCDLGLLMSGPLLEKQFNEIIRFLSKTEDGVEEIFDNLKSVKKRKHSTDQDFEKINEIYALTIEVSPSMEKFQQNYYLKSVPVIIDKQMSHWPAMSKWNVEYIRRISGRRTVPIEIVN